MMKQTRFRQQLFEVYKSENEDAAKKIGYISREIKNKNRTISFIYGLAFYSKVEQLFLNYSKQDIEDLMQLFIGHCQNDSSIIQQENQQIQVICNWLSDIQQFMDQKITDKNEFIQFYNRYFYETVFREYNPNNNNNNNNQNLKFIEDSLTFASSIYIMHQAATNNSIEDLKTFTLTLFGDTGQLNNNYLSLLTEQKLEQIVLVYEFMIRVYSCQGDYLPVYDKKAYKDASERDCHQAAFYIFNESQDTFRLAYDQNYSCQYNHYNYKKIQQTQIEIETQLAMEAIQSQYEKVQDEIKIINQLLKQEQIINQKQEMKNVEYEQQLQNFEYQVNQYQQKYYQIDSEINQLYEAQSILQQTCVAKNNYEQNEQIRKQKEIQQKCLYEQQLYQQNQNIKYQQMRAKFSNNSGRINNQVFSQSDSIEMTQVNYNQIDNFHITQIISQSKVFLPKKNKFYCSICQELKESNEIVNFSCCRSQFCKECVIGHFENTEEINKNKQLICPQYDCKKPLQNINQFYDLNLITDKVKKALQFKANIICPSCNTQFVLKNRGAATTGCPGCKKTLCTGCQQLSHNKEDVICKDRINNYIVAIGSHQESINNLIIQQQNLLQQDPNNQQIQIKIQELLKERRFRICPKCTTLLIKDDHCEHIVCQECDSELCFACVCYRQPTLQHDNQFHREGCPYVTQRLPQEIKFNEKCKECVRNQKVCQLPESWNDYCTSIRQNFGEGFYNTFPENWECQ